MHEMMKTEAEERMMMLMKMLMRMVEIRKGLKDIVI